MLEATDALEAIGDIIVSNLVRMGEVRIENSIEVSTQTRRMIESYHRSVLDAFQLALVALTQKDEESARGVSAMKKVVRSEEAALRDRYTERLTIDEPNRVATYRFEVDVMTHLKRIYYFTRRIARVAIPDTEQAKVGNDPLRDPS